MRHRLRRRAEVSSELVRLTRDGIACALAYLAASGPVDQRVHSVRQWLKRVRSTLRVLDGALGEESRTARRQAGGIARLLASARDADVAAASARVLSATTAAAGATAFEQLADTLDREAEVAHRQRVPLGDIKRQLRELAALTARFPTDFDGGALLNAALARSYRRGRKTMSVANRTRATDDLHRWRKEAKHLWHLVGLTRPRLRKRTRKLAEPLDRLAELLGLDHDHAMLAERVALAPHQGSPTAELSLIAERRHELQDQAMRLGGRIYADKPKAFARRNRLCR
jgi:CHAD domain-containing protein